MSKKTLWFPAEIKPIRAGWYESYKAFPDLMRLRYWDGETWLFKDENRPHFNQLWIWRGLAEQPK